MFKISFQANNQAVIRDIIKALQPFLLSEESLKITGAIEREEGSTVHKVFYCPHRLRLVKATTLSSDV